MTTSVSKVEETIPPIIGTAMRCITSDPVPWLHMIGNSPAMMAADGHHLRADALKRAAPDGSVEIVAAERPPPASIVELPNSCEQEILGSLLTLR